MAARQELHSGLSEMATQTQNYKLHKFELKDTPADITAINASMDIIDTQLKSLADGKFDKTGGTISGNLVVNGSTTLKKLTASELDLNGNADVSGTLKVTGATTLTGKLTANGGVTTKALTATSLDLNGNGDVSGSLTVHGDLNAQGGLNVTDITATGATTLVNLNAANITATGTLKVNGATTLTGLLTANGGVTTKKVTATELDLNGNGDVSGNLNVGGLLQVTGKAIVDDIAIRGSSTDFAGDRGQIGNCPEATDIDFNEYTKSGVWRISGTSQNAGAFGNVTGFLIVYGNLSQNYVFQIFARSLNSDGFYIRTKHGVDWQPWRRVILDQNVNDVGLVSFLQAQNLTAEQKTQALQNIGALPLTGGDLTGDVTNTGVFTATGTKAYTHKRDVLDRTNPTEEVQSFPLTLVDKNGKTVALIKHWHYVNGRSIFQFGVAKDNDSDGTAWSLIEVGFDENGNTFTNIPSTPSDANSTQAATAKFVNDRIKNSTDVVHTTGSETINGSKTFGSPVVSNANSLIQSANWSGIRLGDTSRTSDSIKMLAQVLDADGQRWIGLETTANTEGHRTVQLIGRNRTNTAWLNFIKFWDRADGSFYATLAANTPRDAVNTEIATAKFVNDQIQNIDDKIVRPIAWRETGSAPGGPVVVTINNLVVGQTLYLLLDTNNGLSDISRTATYDFTGLNNNEQIGIFNPQNRSFNMFARTVAEETVTITMNLNGCSDMSIVVFGVTNA